MSGRGELAAAAGIDWELLAAGGGEDYELLATVAADRLDEAIAAVASTGVALTVVGETATGTGAALRRPDGGAIPLVGFDQLIDRRSPDEPA